MALVQGERTMVSTQSRPSATLSLMLTIVVALAFVSAQALPVDEVRRAQGEQVDKDKTEADRQAKQAADAKARTEQQPKRDAARARQRDANSTTPGTPPVPAPVVRQPFAEDIERYVDIFSKQNSTQQIQACKELEYAGLSDARIFDLVESKLLQVYQSAKDGDSVAYATWLTRALAYSGQGKYRNTLQAVTQHAGHRKLSKQASVSLKTLDDYTVWTPIIGNTATYNRDKSPEINRLGNMLRGQVAALQKLAATRILDSEQFDPYLLQTLQQKISGMLGSKADDATEEALVWMLRALASSRSADYQPTLQEAASHAASSSVRKYAANYLKKYY